jgi:hypothetical protein
MTLAKGGYVPLPIPEKTGLINVLDLPEFVKYLREARKRAYTFKE